MDAIHAFINNLGGLAGIIAIVWVIQMNKKIQAMEKEIMDLKRELEE